MGRSRVSRVRVAGTVLSGGFVLFTLARILHGWRDWVFATAFYLGAGGMVFLFMQWRQHGNLAARAWCVTAFATWMAAVFLFNSAYIVASVIAAVALGIGLVGALTVFLRTNRQKDARARPE
ncbi:hypothetical protein OG607_19420 [Streptomyces sp. NBC_01537]|uniref:hypothetical protein n=1 Tax=Streptomyces sp. NBC_01537 TaxID=2903896 RepID=UPI00386333A5